MRDNVELAFPSKRVSHWQAKPGPTINSPSTAEAVYEYHGGMSLRDYFAAQALAGMDHGTRKTLHQGALSEGIDMTEAIAISCYEIADAMLKEREK